MTEFQPYKKLHPIRSVTIAIDFSREINESDFDKFISNVSDVREEFPIRKLGRSLQLLLDVGANERNYTASNLPGITGVLLVKEDSDGERERFAEFRDRKLFITDWNMDSWGNVKGRSKVVFQKLLSNLLFNLGVEGIHVHFSYSYISVHEEESHLKEGRDLFQETSAFVTSKCISSKGVWHCHSGFCEDFDSPLPHTLITNLAIDITDTLPEDGDAKDNKNYERNVSLSTLHKVVLRDVTNPDADPDEFYSDFELFIEFISKKNMSMMKSILLDRYSSSLENWLNA